MKIPSWFWWQSAIFFGLFGLGRDLWVGEYGWAIADFLVIPIAVVRGFYYWFHMWITF